MLCNHQTIANRDLLIEYVIKRGNMQHFLSVFRPNPSFSASVLSHEKTSNNGILSIKTNKIQETMIHIKQ